jgi:ADP-ribose pyrophosphatase
MSELKTDKNAVETQNGALMQNEVPVKLKRRELAYQGAILKVYRDYVEIKGKEAVWDFIHHDGAAAVLPVTDDGKILMVRQYRNALKRFTLEIPAGKVDSPDEPRVLCAFRELEEETGMKVSRPEDLEFLIRINTTVAFCDEEIDIFIARGLIKSHQHLDEDEEINVVPMELEKLLEMIYKGEIKDGKTVAAITAYAVKCNRKNG